MKELNHCPSTLADGFSTYSPTACKKLFDGQKVSHLLDFEIDEISKTSETMIAMRRISVSGAQEKFPAVIENGIIRISQTDERSRYILKPAPWDNTLYTRKQIPANEHLTMQIASQVYGIITAENGLCFTPSWRYGIYTISYCHLSAFWVSKGRFVNAGEVLGVSGSSGMSTGPHLHLTTKKDGKVFDPVILLKYVQCITK